MLGIPTLPQWTILTLQHGRILLQCAPHMARIRSELKSVWAIREGSFSTLQSDSYGVQRAFMKTGLVKFELSEEFCSKAKAFRMRKLT